MWWFSVFPASCLRPLQCIRITAVNTIQTKYFIAFFYLTLTIVLRDRRLNFKNLIAVRTQHEMYPFYKFLSVQHSIVDYRYNTVQRIFRTHSSYLTETLCSLISNSPFPHPSKPGQFPQIAGFFWDFLRPKFFSSTQQWIKIHHCGILK